MPEIKNQLYFWSFKNFTTSSFYLFFTFCKEKGHFINGRLKGAKFYFFYKNDFNCSYI